MKPTTRQEKIDLIEHCVDVHKKLEKLTHKKLKCPIGTLKSRFSSPLTISVTANYEKAIFYFDGVYDGCVDTYTSSEIIEKIDIFETYDDVYLKLNELIEKAYEK